MQSFRPFTYYPVLSRETWIGVRTFVVLIRKWCSPGRRDSVWYQVCLGHMFVLEIFMIRLLLVYQKHCSLSENIHLLVFSLVSTLVNIVI